MNGCHVRVSSLVSMLQAVSIMLFFAVTLSAQDARIAAELSDSMAEVPLKKTLGEKAFNQAIGSGDYRYVGNTKCRLCHRKFFLGRKKDPHDFAMNALVASGHEENPRCLLCHATGFGVETGFVNMESTPRLANVQCEGCHGPGNVHIQRIKAKKRGGFLVGTDKPKRLKRMCQSCHTKRWDRSYHDLDKAYDKYKNADPNAKKGRYGK